MTYHVTSIRRQLLAWLLIPILSLCLIFAIATYVIAIDFATDSYDSMLEDSARIVAGRLHVVNGHVELDLPPAAQAILREDSHDRFYYQVRNAAGELITGDKVIPTPDPLDVEQEPQFVYGKINEQPVRIGYMQCLVFGVPTRTVLVQVAETLIGRQQLTRDILVTVVLPQLVLVVLAAFLVWFGVARGLSPLKQVQESISKRTQWDLHPIDPAEAPKEIRPLLSAINQLLSRLSEDIELQRRFVANAAHQLRTPLAGLKTQTELALRDNKSEKLDHALKQIYASADQATRLVNQMLSLAKLEGAMAKQSSFSLFDLNEVVCEATKEVVPFALAKQIDLGFEQSPKPVMIEGDALSLQELTLNLVDNAIRYTQAGGKVTVRIELGTDSVGLLVEDNGPGIPSEERERVFERFYRVVDSKKTEGSGLGLAIVQEIAEAHNARVSLSDVPGKQGALAKVEFVLTQHAVIS